MWMELKLMKLLKYDRRFHLLAKKYPDLSDINNIEADEAVQEMFRDVLAAEPWRGQFISDNCVNWAIRLTRIEF